MELPPIPSQYMVSYERRKINHLLHLVLTLLTFGMWGIVWLILGVVAAFSNPERKVTGVYGATHPGHPGQAGVPELPSSEMAMCDPRPSPAATRRAKMVNAKTVGIVGALLAVLCLPGGNWGGALVFASVFGGIAGLMYYRADQLAPRDPNRSEATDS